MSWINWRIGLAFSLVLTLNFIIGFILKQFDLTETLHSIIIYGLIFFVVAGFMGNFLWKYRWFKVLSITIAISFTLIFLGENVFNEEYGILPILGYLLFPSSAIYLSIDKLSPPWIRGASLGIIVTFWPLFLFPLIRWGRVEETGYFIALIAIPLTIIGFIIGLVIGIIINMIKNKRNK